MDNSGEKSRNDFPVSTADLTWMTGDVVPQVANQYKTPGSGGGLRGMEANTDESKGSPCPTPSHGTASTHEFGVNSAGHDPDESY